MTKPPFGKIWISGAIAFLLIAGGVVLSTSGCGEKSAPAAVRSLDSSSTANGGATNPGASNVSQSVAAAPAAPVRRQFARDITFDTVKLNMQKGDPFKESLLTPQIKKLDGNRIRIRGFILPPAQETGLTQFVLVRDNMACCFGPGAALYDSMIVNMQPGLSLDYTVVPITVEGTFNIHQVQIGGRTLSIYHVTADKAH